MFVVQKMPDPGDGGYHKASNIGSRISCRRVKVARLSCSRAIATCSSLRCDGKFFVTEDMNILVQGGGAPRANCLSNSNHAAQCAFGTDSFWGGVDVPGEALSNVIITRLPFAVPDHPLIEAKLELIESAVAIVY